VHSGYLGHPIVGDIFYGGNVVGTPEVVSPTHPPGGRPFVTYARTKEEGDKLETESLTRETDEPWLMRYPALHAALLTINHPTTQQRLTFTAPVHPPMLDLIHALRANGYQTAITDGTHIDLDAAIPDPPI
jgi:23S rRNA-/tRNA-specific pseudouridylate synthase